MLKIVCITPDSDDHQWFYIQVPEPPEKHFDYIREAVKKYCGTIPHQVRRTLPFRYELSHTYQELPDVADELIRLVQKDY